MGMRSEFRNIQQLSSVTFVPNVSLEHTISALICGLTQMSDLSFVQYVEKHLHVNMIGNVTRDCIREKRNSYVKESSSKEASGDVVDDLLELMHWAAISDQKLAESASNHF
jgi:hypothetical protein